MQGNPSIPIVGGISISNLTNKSSLLEDDLFIFADESAESNYNISLSQLRSVIFNALNSQGDILYYNGSAITKLPIGSSGYVLTSTGTSIAWSEIPVSNTDVLSSIGDMLYYNNLGEYARIPIGSNNQVLRAINGIPTWSTLSLYNSPLTAKGDIVYLNSLLNPDRLPIGSNGTYLKSDNGVPIWASLNLYQDPTTTSGDILYKNGTTTTRLGIGSNGQILTVSGGLPSWVTLNNYQDPLNTNGQILVRSGSSTVPLNAGTSGQVLTIVAGVPQWDDIPDTFVDPSVSTGDIIYKLGSLPARLPIGSSDQLLTVEGGIPKWKTLSYQPLSPNLTALSSFSSLGILISNASNSFIARSIQGEADKIVVTNGDGVSGNPTITLNSLVTSEIAANTAKITDANFIFNQPLPSASWSITHALNKRTSVTIVDTSGNTVIGDVSYISDNELTVTFSSSFAGKAYLN